MCKFRWTMKELQEKTSRQLLLELVRERGIGLNPYAPLASRLTKLEQWVETWVPKG